ncbi:hypothetical protein ACIRBZ_09495 [Streptomyces sp. NPDC094038]|uniref:hypothetical protein n=1 Tax=Streptomyces sp. NPDC094038 TaxID=3366055 RepID=UPI0038177E56
MHSWSGRHRSSASSQCRPGGGEDRVAAYCSEQLTGTGKSAKSTADSAKSTPGNGRANGGQGNGKDK